MNLAYILNVVILNMYVIIFQLKDCNERKVLFLFYVTPSKNTRFHFVVVVVSFRVFSNFSFSFFFFSFFLYLDVLDWLSEVQLHEH